MSGAPPLGVVIYTQKQIQDRVSYLAGRIRADLHGERPLLISILSGSVMFLADLVRSLGVDADIDFMSVSSYSSRRQPTGVVRIMKDVEYLLMDRQVILVEDIVDTGLTLAFLLRTLEARNPRSITVCTLIDKPVRRIAQPIIHYAGFQTEEFLVGYGLDFKGKYRNLPYLVGIRDVPALALEPGALEHLFTQTRDRI